MDHHVSKCTAIEVADVLLTNDSIRNLQTQKPDPSTEPLLIACAEGRICLVKSILLTKADVNRIDHRGWTCLHEVCSRGFGDVAQHLLTDKANILARTRSEYEGLSVLHVAATNGNRNIVQHILRDADKLSSSGEAQVRPSVVPHKKSLGGLPPSTSSSDAQSGGKASETCFFAASRKDFIDLVAARGWTSLFIASARGYDEVVDLLLDGRADPDCLHERTRLTPMEAAVAQNRYPVVKSLIKHHADVNRTGVRGGTALVAASYHGYTNIVRALLEGKANVDQQTDSWSPIMEAQAQGHDKVVDLLLKFGATLPTSREKWTGVAYADADTIASKDIDAQKNLIPYYNDFNNHDHLGCAAVLSCCSTAVQPPVEMIPVTIYDSTDED